MTTTINPNGRTERKSLAEQIDRLDGILDGLAEGLNEAVLTAVKDAVALAVRQAIQAALTEVLTNPDLLGLLRGHLAPAVPPTANFGGDPTSCRPASFLKRVGACARRQWDRACRATAALPGFGGRAVVAGWQLLRRFQGQALLSVAIGTAAGVAAYFAGPWLAAGAAWLGGFAAALATQVALGMRRALLAVPFPLT